MFDIYSNQNDIDSLTFHLYICKLSIITSSKLIKLHWRVFYWTITGRIQKLSSKISLNLKDIEAKNILIIFPMDEPSFRVATYTFRRIGSNDSYKKNYKFIIKEQFKDLFHIQSGRSILVKDSDCTNVLLDEQEILIQLQNIQYDVIVDLNSYFHLGIARLISLLKANVKMGFKSSFSEKFYNIQLDISKTGVMEKGYKQVHTMLAL